MKKLLLLLFTVHCSLLTVHCSAQRLSMADSAIWYLKQVKGLQKSDSVLLEKAVAAIYNTPPDSLYVEKIEAELKKLLPVIHRQNCLTIKVIAGYVLNSGKDIDDMLVFGSIHILAELVCGLPEFFSRGSSGVVFLSSGMIVSPINLLSTKIRNIPGLCNTARYIS